MSEETFEHAREYARQTVARGYRTGVTVVAVSLIINGWDHDDRRCEEYSTHAVEYDHDHGRRAWVIWSNGWRDAVKAIYLMDDGLTVVPTYVSGHMPADGGNGDVFLNPFPVNVDSSGSPIMRSDDRNPVDYSRWMLAASRCYHVKITRTIPALNGEAY